MADLYGVENGLAGYTPGGTNLDQDLQNAEAAGLAAAELERLQRAETTSKIAEKQRRLIQTTERKQRELIGGDPTDYGSDSWAVRKLKEYTNMALPHDYQIPVEVGGKQYNTQNKNFNSEDLTNVWNDTQEDPNGDSVLYYMRKEDGYNDDGTPKWLYKPGIAKFGSADRYKNQLNQEGWQLLGEKRTNNAAQIEAMIHGNEQFLKQRTHDYGQASMDPNADQYQNTFGGGKSELYNTDILGLGNQTDAQIEANRILGMDNEAAYRKKLADDPDGRMGNLVDALQSRSVSTIAGMADAVYDTFSDNEHNALNDWKDTTKTDKLFGYNASTSASGLDKAAMDFKTGNYLSMIGNAFAVAPELIAESLPEMATMMRTAGLGAITAMRSNDIMDDILENNEGQITSGQRLQAITAGTLMTGLDKFGLDEMVKGNALGKQLVKKVFDNSSEQASKGVARKLIEKTAQLSLAGEAEAGTEMLQDIVEQYGSKYGTKAEKELWNQEMIDNIIKAGLGGFAAGTTMRGGADLVQAVAGKAKAEPGSDEPVYSQVNNLILKTAQDLENGKLSELTPEDKTTILNNIEEAKASIDDAKSQDERVIAAEAILRSVDNVAAANSYPSEEAHLAEVEAAKAVLAQEKAKQSASTTENTTQEQDFTDPTLSSQLDELDALDAEDVATDTTPTEEAVAPTPVEDTSSSTTRETNRDPRIPPEVQVIPLDEPNQGDVVPETKQEEKTVKIDSNTLSFTTEGTEYTLKKVDSGWDVMLNGEKVTGSNRGGIDTAKSLARKHLAKTKTAKPAKTKAEPKRFKKTESKKDKSGDKGGTPGPLKAVAKIPGVVLDVLGVTPKVSKFTKAIKNIAGKAIAREQSKRKQEKRVAPQVKDDAQMVEVFKSGAYDAKTIANPKLLKKQTRIQTAESIQEKVKLLENVKNILKSGKISNNEAINTKFADMFEGTNEGGALRLALIALHTITENIKSNIDVANNNDFVIETLYSSRQDVAKEISRKFIASYGMQIIPGKDGTAPINLEHINIGNVAVELLKTMGYINTFEGNEAIADVGSSTIVQTNNENVKRDYVKVAGPRIPELVGENVIQFSEGIIDTKGLPENLRSNKVVSIFSEMLSPVMQALDPANERNPDHYPDFSDVEGKDHEMSNSSNDIILSIGAKPMYIKPDTLDLLREIAKLTKNETLADVMNKNPWIKVMFGIRADENVVETEVLSTSGKNISRMHNAEAVINAVKETMAREADGETINPAELYFTYFSAVNMRIHADEIAFNFQSDNFFARHILSPVQDTYTTKDESEVETLVLAVADELGIEPAEVMFYQEPSDAPQETVLDGLNAMLQGEELLKTKDYYDPIYQTDPRTRALFESGKSVNSVIKAIQAVQAIRNGVAEAGGNWKKAKISANYAVEFDGNTSGLVNKLLNMLGGANATKVYEFIKRLTVKEPGKNLDDGYLILAEEVKRLIAEKVALANKKSANPRANKDIKALKAIAKFLEEIDKTMRETSKSPMMNNLYGQMNEALSRNLGFILSGKAITLSKEGSQNIAEAKELVKELAGVEINPNSFTFKQKKDLANKIGTVLGSIFGEALINVNSSLAEDSQAMYDAYDSMYNAAHIINEPLVMRNPYDVVTSTLYQAETGAFTNEFGFSIEKKKIVAMGKAIMDVGSVLPTEEQFMANPNSQKVMPLHAIDSAILLLAYKKTIEKLGLDYDGSMSVHDAVYSTPEFMNTYREMYNESAFDVAQNYDLINETLFQIDYLIKKMTAQKGSPAIIADLKKHKAILEQGNKERMELKEQQLKELQESGASVFGTYNIEMPEPGVRPDPKPDKTVDKTESKKTETVQQETTTQTERSPFELNATGRAKYPVDGNPYVAQADAKQAFIDLKNLIESGKEYVVWDTETSGYFPDGKKPSSTQGTEIIQIAAQKMKNGKKVGDPFIVYLPADKIEPGATKTHRVSIDGKPIVIEGKTVPTKKLVPTGTKEEMVSQFQEYIGDLPLVAFNSKFDERSAELTIGSKLKNKTVDAYHAALWDMHSNPDAKELKDRKQVTLAGQAYNNEIDTNKAHDAEYDIELLNMVIDGVSKSTQPVDKFSHITLNDFGKFLKTFPKSQKSADIFSIGFLKHLAREVGEESKGHIGSIINFIENKGKRTTGKEFEYIPKNDTVIIPDNAYKDVKNTKDMIRYIAHEIEHKATAKWIFEQSQSSNPSKEYKYIKKIFQRLQKADVSDLQYEDKNSFGQNTYDRVQYIIDPEKSEYEQISEFVAIYRTNEAFREVIKDKISTSQGVITRLVQSIKDLVNAGMNALTDFDARSMTAETINDVMNNIVILGEQSRLGSKTAEAPSLGAGVIVSEIDNALSFRPYKGSTPLYFMPFESKIVSFNHWAQEGIAKGARVTAGVLIDNDWVQKMHKKQMSIEDGLYNRTAQLIKERFEPGAFMSRLATYMQLNDKFDYKNIRQWHTAINKAKQARNQVDTDMLIRAKRTFDETTKNYSQEEIDAIESMFNSSLIHELKNENGTEAIIDQILNSNNPIETIDALIAGLEEQLTTGSMKINDQTINSYGIGALANDIASYYRTGKLGKLARSEMSDHHVMRRLGGQKLASFNTLIALKQLKMGGSQEISTLKKFKEDSIKNQSGNSYNEFMSVSAANHNLSYKVDQDIDENNQGKFDNVTGSHILFEENYEFLPVDESEYNSLQDREGSPWIILTKPNDEGGKIGLVARIRDDFGMQPGIVSSANLNSDGVQITRKMAEALNSEASNIIRTGSAGDYQYKIILTKDMASKLDVQKNPASNMYRSYGHNTEIFEGKSVLSHLLATETRNISTKEEADALEAELKKGGKINQMFINFDHNSPEIDIRDYPEIRRQFTKAEGLTNVLGFNRRVNMVHKDMKDTMVGYTRDALISEKNPKLRKAEAILRNFVTMFAGHVVMGNPGKIAMDALSNLSILMANNVPFLSMAKYGKEAMKYGVEITNMRNDYIFEQMAMFSLRPGSDEYIAQKKKVDTMLEEINNHPFAVALNNGMIQSLSTSMMMKDKESMSDLQKRANMLFNMIGDIPGAKKAIFAFSKFGVGAEDVLEFARKATKEGSTIDKELKYMAEKIGRIKKEEDLAAYLSEIIATPGQSEILRIGGVATLGVDLSSKWILYKHTMDTLVEDTNPRIRRMTFAQKQELAISIAVDSFINYMDNLPHEIDTAKEVGVWMFPHFMIRVQKVIWGLFYNRMFGSGLATATGLIAGDFGPSIYGSLAGAKLPSQWDPTNLNNILPMQVLNIPLVP